MQKDNFKITITDLTKKNPLLVGNGGTSKLVKIDSGSHIYLLEGTGGGNFVVWTYFPEGNYVVLSKQYSMAGKPFSMLYGGKCENR